MEKLRNLKDRICDFENLMEAYREAASNKRYRDEILEYGFNLGENLRKLQRELLDGTYKVGKYREFYIRYPKPRLIMALNFRDRIVQWAIYRQINPYLDNRYITHSYGCREDKGTLAAAQKFHDWQQLISRKADAKDWYVIKGDISKYFYRVNHERALEVYRNISDDPWFLWLMKSIIDNPDVPFGLPPGVNPDECSKEDRLYEVGMPIGNLTSQETANLYLDVLDEHCKHDLHLHFYIRYMDDFCAFVKSKENARNILAEIEQFLNEELLLDLSPKSKILKATAPIEFVGYLITPHGIRIRKKTTKHMKHSLKRAMRDYADWKIDIEKAKEIMICYKGMCMKVNGYNMCRWIAENFVLQRNRGEPMTNEFLQEPPEGRLFYSIAENEDGTVNVYLRPDAKYCKDSQCVSVVVVSGVEPFPSMEEDIRSRFDAWCDSGELVYL